MSDSKDTPDPRGTDSFAEPSVSAFEEDGAIVFRSEKNADEKWIKAEKNCVFNLSDVM
jgi:hypothetical protein